MFKKGDKVRIKDAMNPDYIGKIGIVEEVSEHAPYCCKLEIDGKEGSWGCAWLFSTIEKIESRDFRKYLKAIEAIKANYPPEHYTMLREALDLAMEALEEKAKKVAFDEGVMFGE